MVSGSGEKIPWYEDWEAFLERRCSVEMGGAVLPRIHFLTRGNQGETKSRPFEPCLAHHHHLFLSSGEIRKVSFKSPSLFSKFSVPLLPLPFTTWQFFWRQPMPKIKWNKDENSIITKKWKCAKRLFLPQKMFSILADSWLINLSDTVIAQQWLTFGLIKTHSIQMHWRAWICDNPS